MTSPSGPVTTWSVEDRLGETFRRALPKLGPEARAQIEAMISPEALATMAGVLVAWVASHAVGLGEIVPKLYVLRHYRVGNRAGSYVRSSLWRYIEEALAETIAQVGANGFRQGFRGLRFPLRFVNGSPPTGAPPH